MRSISTDDVPRLAEDALYTAVGLGVLGFQRVQVGRQHLRRSLTGAVQEAREALDERARLVEERLDDIDERLDEVVESVEPRLPAPACDLARQAIAVARQARTRVLHLVERDDER
jgi:hypothetical protein